MDERVPGQKAEFYDPSLSGFDLDFGRGAQGELFIDDIRKALADKSAQIEVKRDAWWPISERFYVEDECLKARGWEPSGIATTTAKLWGFVGGRHPMTFFVGVDLLRGAVELAKKHPGNKASCDYGKNPTRGWYVYMKHIHAARDKVLDEHKSRGTK